MIESFCRFISWLFNVVPEGVWVTIFLIGTVILKAGGESIFAFAKLVLYLVIAYGLFWILGLLLPTWVEIILVVAFIGLIIWAAK